MYFEPMFLRMFEPIFWKNIVGILGGNVDLFESSRSVLLNKIVINWSKIDFEPVKKVILHNGRVFFGSFSDYSVYGTQN